MEGGAQRTNRESTRRETCVSESPARQSLAELQPGPPLGASSSAPTRPESSGIFFFFPSRNWLWCVARPLPSSSQLLPSFFSSFFFFLRHGPGSGSWKRNKCGKRERKSELNDRMQAT